MRAIRLSITFNDELVELLAQGMNRFGARVVGQTRDRVLDTIENFLARHPVRAVDPVIGICAYPVTGVPFVILYDYDVAELRVHLVIHARADRTNVYLTKVVW